MITPDQALTFILGWFPVVIIGACVVAYAARFIRDQFRDDN
jgi:hypothetical protein